MNILFIGDIFGTTGKRAIAQLLIQIKQKYEIDFTIANAENATNCRGLSISDWSFLTEMGINFFTMGNHTWQQKDFYDLLKTKTNIIRPANIDSFHEYGRVGLGSRVIKVKNKNIRITNLIGRSVKLKNIQINNPFTALREIIDYDENSDFHIVDFHAESTSEKNALCFEFKGKVDVILGTHTHIQTADNRIINNTGFITDVGSTGPANGVIGANGNYITSFLKDESKNILIEDAGGQYQFCAVVLKFNDHTNKIESIDRILIYE